MFELKVRNQCFFECTQPGVAGVSTSLIWPWGRSNGPKTGRDPLWLPLIAETAPSRSFGKMATVTAKVAINHGAAACVSSGLAGIDVYVASMLRDCG